jgi:hypothetical protein
MQANGNTPIKVQVGKRYIDLMNNVVKIEKVTKTGWFISNHSSYREDGTCYHGAALNLYKEIEETKDSNSSINDILNSNADKIINFIGNVKDRWQDEKEHEDIANYMSAINVFVQTTIPHVTEVKASKWAVSFKMPNNRTYSYFLKGNSGGLMEVKKA